MNLAPLRERCKDFAIDNQDVTSNLHGLEHPTQNQGIKSWWYAVPLSEKLIKELAIFEE